MPSLVLHPASAPEDVTFPPANAQQMLNFVAAYLQVSGLENLRGVVVSSTTPAAADRDKAWIKQDPTSLRTLGIYTYVSGEWAAIPVVIPSGESEPSSPKLGELFYNTAVGALRFYNGTAWTSNFWPTGNTASRPTGVPTNYIFFDSQINRLLRWTGSAWTTVDGAVGEVRMIDVASVEDALAANPGWSEFEVMKGRFPIAASDDIPPQLEGGQQLSELRMKWSAKGRSAEGGARESTASFISSITINGSEARADGTKMADLRDIGVEKTVNLTPPYKALIFLRKDF